MGGLVPLSGAGILENTGHLRGGMISYGSRPQETIQSLEN